MKSGKEIKHYKVTVTTHTIYKVFIIHNETTGEIQMTSLGMSIDGFNSCLKDVIATFKKQKGLPV